MYHNSKLATVILYWQLLASDTFCFCFLRSLRSPCSQPNERVMRKYAWVYPISGDAGQWILCKHATNSSSIHFPVDTPPLGTPTWWRSHDSYMHCVVSCNDSIEHLCMFYIIQQLPSGRIEAVIPHSLSFKDTLKFQHLLLLSF